MKGSTNYKFKVTVSVSVAPYINAHVDYKKQTVGTTKDWKTNGKGSTDESGNLYLKTSGGSNMDITIQYNG
ncbi:hypothetical protein [Piscirickettsia litoralis]|uniref:Uncharacterized protein n=1 Tax=Piscirickettsia litoralis TaxID=1891921 RepID=A0ABX3A0W4_9GAMM|nr:hypothetical protein [Piscirickettsia litoralis]ODN42448.1 hypothetical protein BGC07_05265 [Piscirickettsia litoralis]